MSCGSTTPNGSFPPEALNEDAALILDDMPLAGVDIDVATNAIIGSMVKNGYLSELSNSILLSVSSDDAQKSAEVTARLTGEINAALGSFQGSVIAQQLTTDEEIQSIAATYDISEGKASLVRSIHAALPMLAEKDLAAMSINDLNLLAESKQVTPPEYRDHRRCQRPGLYRHRSGQRHRSGTRRCRRRRGPGSPRRAGLR